MESYFLFTEDGSIYQCQNLNTLKRIMHNQYYNEETNKIIKRLIDEIGYYVDTENKSILCTSKMIKSNIIENLRKKFYN